MRSGDGHQAEQSLGLRRGDATAGRRQPVVPAPLVVLVGRRTPGGLRDPAILQHAVQRAVQRAGLELQFAVGQAGDLLQQSVAVPLMKA